MEREILGLMGAMNIKSEEKEDYVILRLKGQVDIYNARNLEQIVEAFALHAAKKIILDFKDLAYMDSSGIACLIKVDAFLKDKKDKKLILVNLNDKLNDLFKLAKVDTLFNIVKTLDEAKNFKG